MNGRAKKIEMDLKIAFEKAADREIESSESGIVAAEASEAICLAIEKFRALLEEEGLRPEAAGVAALRDFSARIERLRAWRAAGGI